MNTEYRISKNERPSLRFARSFVLTAALSILAAGPLDAQVRIGLSAFAGGYVPTGDVPLPGQLPLDLSQDAGPLVGGRLAAMFSRLGLEAEAGYAFSGVDEFVAREEDLPIDAGIFLGSVSLVFVLYEAPFSPLSIYLTAGGGLVNRGGEYYELFEDAADLAAAFGLGFRYGLSPLLAVRFDLRDYVSSFAPTTRSGIEKESRTQNDLIATIGMEFSFSPAP